MMYLHYSTYLCMLSIYNSNCELAHVELCYCSTYTEILTFKVAILFLFSLGEMSDFSQIFLHCVEKYISS